LLDDGLTANPLRRPSADLALASADPLLTETDRHEGGTPCKRRIGPPEAEAPRLQSWEIVWFLQNPSFARRNPDVVGSGDLGVRHLGGYIYPLEPAFPFRGSLENHVVLVLEILLQAVQVGFETDQT